MRKTGSAVAVALMALALGCGQQSPGDGMSPGPLPLVREPVAPPGTQSCGLPPPALMALSENQTLRGQFEIRSALAGGPCDQAPSVTFTVMRFSGEIVLRECSSSSPARVSWDTRKAGDGVYWVMAQRSCSCTAVVCTEYESVRVVVDN